MASIQLFGPYAWAGSMPGGSGHVWTIRVPSRGKVFAATAIPHTRGEAYVDFGDRLTVEEIDVTRAPLNGWFLNIVVRNKGMIPVGYYELNFTSAA